MDYIFHSLSDIALRRVYKFVLKQTIGKYLKDDLLIDQLKVQTREGIIRINDLELDCIKLNDEIGHLPFSIAKASINEIEAFVSYSTLLTESCRFVVDTITINVEPNSRFTPSGLGLSETDSPKFCDASTHLDQDTGISDEAEEGLTFIAQWIEIIVAKLRIAVKNIAIQLNPVKGRGVSLCLSDLQFWNSDPSILSNANSIDASHHMMNSIDLAQSLLSSSKIIVIGCIQFKVIADHSALDVVRTRGETTVRMRPNAKAGSLAFDKLDIDVNIAPLQIDISGDLLTAVLSLIDDIKTMFKRRGSTFASQTSVSDVIAALQLSQHDMLNFSSTQPLFDKDEAQLNRSILTAYQRLKKKRSFPPEMSLLQRQPPSSSLMSNIVVEEFDSDGDFPENDGTSSDVSESDFHDTIDQKPLKIVGTSSFGGVRAQKLDRSTFDSSIFASAISGSAQAGNATQVSSFVRVRLSIPLVSILVVDEERAGGKLSLQMEDFVVLLEQTNIVDNHDAGQTNIKATLRDITLLDSDSLSEERVLLSFHRNQEHGSIFSLPAISMDYHMSRPASLNISVQPFAISFDFSLIDKWVKFISKFRFPSFDDSSSPSDVNIIVHLLSVSVAIHSHPQIPSTQWFEVLDSVRLDVNFSNWYEVKKNSESNNVYQHLCRSPGGLSFTFDDINLRLDPNTSEFSVNMRKALFEIFLKDSLSSTKVYKSCIIEAKCSENDESKKLHIKFGSSSILAESSNDQQKADRGLIEDMGPQEPRVDPSKTIFIATQELRMEIQQREYNALITLSDLLSPHDTSSSSQVEAPPITQPSSSGSFRVIINATKAFLVVGENDFIWSKGIGPKCTGISSDIFASLSQLCGQFISNKHILPNQKNLKLCIAIRDPEIRITQADKDIFVELKANDLSIFEMGSRDFLLLKRENFDFFHAPRIKSRHGDEISKIPVIHRAFIRNHPDHQNTNYNDHLANHTTFGCAFEVRLLLTEAVSGSNSTDVVKCLHLFIDFYDIIINYDPSATWLLKLVKLLTPLTVTQCRYTHVAELLHSIDKHCHLNQFSDVELSIIESARKYLASNLQSTEEVSTDPVSLSIPFEMTKVSARVRSSLIDYFSVSTKTSMLLSADVIALSSTIVSNSDRFTLKISLSNLSFYLSDTSTHIDSQPSSCDWKDRYGYLDLVTIDRLTTIVTIQNKIEQDVTLEFIFGSCLIQGCVDSLMLLGNNFQEWLKGFESACLEADNIRTLPTSNVLKTSSEGDSIDHIDRVRICLAEEEEDYEELISRDLIDGPANTFDALQDPINLPNVSIEGLLNGVVEDYYQTEDKPSFEGERWEADYDYDDLYSVHNHNISDAKQLAKPFQIGHHIDDEDMEEDEAHQSLSKSVLMFSKPPSMSVQDLELQPLTLPKDVEDNLCQEMEVLQPGMTESELVELEDLEKAWEDIVEDFQSNNTESADVDEQKAFWYKHLSEPEVDFQYLNKASSLHAQRMDLFHNRPAIEKNQSHDIVVVVQGNVKIRIYEGFELLDTDRNRVSSGRKEKSSLEIHLNGVVVQVFSYRVNLLNMADVMPKERIDVMVKDTVVIFNSKPHKSRNKVLGAWKSSQRPWDDTKYMMSCTLLSYATQNPDFSGIPVDSDTSSKLEHRLYISLMPLRCFLTEEFIHFIKGIAEGQTAGNNNGTDLPSSRPPTEVNLYFQTIVMDQADMKINYKASAVNIGSLQNGDYLQLLNIFPIDGLELTLKSIRLNGVGDLNAAAGHIVETWVKDIYKNQLHKVIAGAAPLKGIAHISNDMHSLLFSGGSKIRGNNRQVIHHLQKGTKALATTIAKEALDVTHKLTMFVAQTITDLASDPEIEHGTASTKKPLKQPKNIGEGLHRAVDSVAREINGVAETVIAVPIRQYERSGTTGLLRSVVRALPVAVLRPIAGVTEGVSYTILGFRNHLDPTLKRDEEDMWDVGET